MVKRITGTIRGILSFTLYFLNTLFWTLAILFIAFFKILVPIKSWQDFCGGILTSLADGWIRINIVNHQIFSRIIWKVEGTEGLKQKDWYMVIANHQSWVDILVLQKIFYRKIPFLKFFLKNELIWFPVLGQAWWALDFPFMKRYSVSDIKKNPGLRGKDLEITQKACKKFKTIPTSIMNFVEGTRFTREKHLQQKSPFNNLLRSKAGGLAFAMASIGDQMRCLLDVTIVYPDGKKNFWDFICGNIGEIRVKVKSYPINLELIGDYSKDREFRKNFHKWLNDIWEKKDLCIQEMKTSDENIAATHSG